MSLLLLELLLESVALSYHRWVCNDLNLRCCVCLLLKRQVLLLKSRQFTLVFLHLALGFSFQLLLSLQECVFLGLCRLGVCLKFAVLFFEVLALGCDPLLGLGFLRREHHCLLADRLPLLGQDIRISLLMLGPVSSWFWLGSLRFLWLRLAKAYPSQASRLIWLWLRRASTGTSFLDRLKLHCRKRLLLGLFVPLVDICALLLQEISSKVVPGRGGLCGSCSREIGLELAMGRGSRGVERGRLCRLIDYWRLRLGVPLDGSSRGQRLFLYQGVVMNELGLEEGILINCALEPFRSFILFVLQ